MIIEIEKTFQALPREEREAIIQHGAVLRLSSLEKQFALAEQKTRGFEEKYHITLSKLETEGLPDNASHEMHEEYILWRHWAMTASKVKQELPILRKIVQQAELRELPHAGD